MSAWSGRFVALMVFALTTGEGRPVAEARDNQPQYFQRAREPVTPISSPPVATDRRADLGERLFRDPLLSRNRDISCNSCHELDGNGSRPDGLERHLPSLSFDIPTIFNVAGNFSFGWRAEFTSLDRQNEDALTNARIMNIDWQTLRMRLAQDRIYSRLFRDLYGREADEAAILDALRRFEASLVTPAPFDEFLKGDEEAISSRARHGYGLFKEFGCASCHQGANVGGNLLERFGLFAPVTVDLTRGSDLGRYLLTKKREDVGVFRVPSLRNVAVTGPYFHDGRETDLGRAVRLMSEYQLGRDIDDEDVALIVEFLQTLTGRVRGRDPSSGPIGGGR